MSQDSILHTTSTSGDGASPITEARWASFYRRMFGSGVLAGVDNELAVSGTGMPLTVATGAAIVNGYPYYNDAPAGVSVTLGGIAATTGGHVTLRLDTSAHTVRAAIALNTSGDTNPPALQQSGSIYEIRLASFTVTTGGVVTLTDARSYAHYGTRVATSNIDALAVTNAKIAVSAVDDAKIGNRVPVLTHRQGGNATDWGTNGTTTYVPTTIRMQLGDISLSIPNGTQTGSVTITYPIAFSGTPNIQLTTTYLGFPPSSYAVNIGTVINSPTKLTQFDVRVGVTTASHGGLTLYFDWLAIGPM